MYAGARFALLTQHGKEQVFRPAFEAAFGARVELVTGLDTDTLGTFTRDVPRAGTQLEAARQKARLGMERARLPLGLASEGSFGPGPLGLGSWNVELVVLIDAVRGVEVVGRAEAPGRCVQGTVSSREALEALAQLADFPRHGLVLRPDDAHDPRVQKGISSWDALDDAWLLARASSRTGSVFVESDLRAHLNPTRMALIDLAVRDLVARLSSACPRCNAPGFGVAARVPGLKCSACGAETRRPRAARWDCVRCEHREERPLPDLTADPASCDACNP